MIIVLLADGFEEIEALLPVDMLRRAGRDVKTVGIKNKTVVGSHGITVIADAETSEIDLSMVDMAVFPGGMPGATNLDASPFSDEVIRAVVRNGGRLAAICAAPLVFGRRGLLDGKMATCFPGFEKELRGAIISTKAVVTDGMITTANGMPAAYKFAEELVRLTDKEKADEIKEKTEETEEEASPSPEMDEEAAEITATVTEALTSFNVKAKVSLLASGPRIYLFEITPAKGVKAQSIVRLFDDIKLFLGREGVRMLAPLPGKPAIGLEVPKGKASPVMLSELLCDKALMAASPTTVPIGRGVAGEPIFVDITKLPHLLIGGATGMGKGVLASSIIVSLAKRCDPSELKMILIDPKKVEYTSYSALPHLACPVIQTAGGAVAALKWAAEEMERRYDLLSSASVRRIDDYNARVREGEKGEILPKIVIIIDELSDLMLWARQEIEAPIMSIAQKARAAGIHIIIGTQRPTADVITGVIKANIPSRAACRVCSSVDSRTILEAVGAEKLLNSGDMLFLRPGAVVPERIQGAFISDRDILAAVDGLSEKLGAPSYLFTPTEAPVSTETFTEDGEEEEESIFRDECFIEALNVAVKNGKISTSLLQRKLSIGYSKAAKYIDYMEEIGFVSESCGSKPRDVLATEEQLREFLKEHE